MDVATDQAAIEPPHVSECTSADGQSLNARSPGSGNQLDCWLKIIASRIRIFSDWHVGPGCYLGIRKRRYLLRLPESRMSNLIAPIEERPNAGISILLASQLILLLLDTSAKWMSGQGIPTGEIVFIRYAVHVALILIFVWPIRKRELFRTASWKLEVLRGICLLGTTACNFLAMRYLPLTVTGALLFTSPLLVCALSGPLLGETIGWRRWLAILAGFIGILIIVRPGSEAFQPASLLGLSAALFIALFSIITRKLAGRDTAMTQQFYAGAVALLLVTPFAFNGWVWPSNGITWLAFWGAGTVGMVGHILVSVAHRFAPPSILAPFNYLTLLYLAAVSWALFNQPPDSWFYLGASIIIASGLFIWLRERQLNSTTTSVDEAALS